MFRTAALLIAIASPALADFPETVRQHILPGYARLTNATADLAATAGRDCAPEALFAPFNTAYDAWIGVQHIRVGPVEEDGRSLAIAFWPDPKGLGAKAQRAILSGDPDLLSPERFAEQSVAARGLTALERLLYTPDQFPTDTCALIRATTDDLARMAREIEEEWLSAYAETVLTAGEPGNTSFLSRPEARQALFTQLAAGLEFVADQRLKRPLGTYDRPRPERAEARASGRSMINTQLSLRALREMVETLTPDAPQTIAGFDHAIELADAIDDPTLVGVGDPDERFRIEVLADAIGVLRKTILSELAPELDVGIGFNAADGD